jgi:hypothetical protein
MNVDVLLAYSGKVNSLVYAGFLRWSQKAKFREYMTQPQLMHTGNFKA